MTPELPDDYDPLYNLEDWVDIEDEDVGGMAPATTRRETDV